MRRCGAVARFGSKSGRTRRACHGELHAGRQLGEDVTKVVIGDDLRPRRGGPVACGQGAAKRVQAPGPGTPQARLAKGQGGKGKGRGPVQRGLQQGFLAAPAPRAKCQAPPHVHVGRTNGFVKAVALAVIGHLGAAARKGWAVHSQSATAMRGGRGGQRCACSRLSRHSHCRIPHALRWCSAQALHCKQI